MSLRVINLHPNVSVTILEEIHWNSLSITRWVYVSDIDHKVNSIWKSFGICISHLQAHLIDIIVTAASWRCVNKLKLQGPKFSASRMYTEFIMLSSKTIREEACQDYEAYACSHQYMFCVNVLSIVLFAQALAREFLVIYVQMARESACMSTPNSKASSLATTNRD